MNILVTGAAGFIGFHTSMALLQRGDTVIGLDNMNAYYDPQLKAKRLEILQSTPGFSFIKGDIKNMADLEQAFTQLGSGPDTRVIHLAAQAGVRHSIENPNIFVQDNIQGTNNVLECCKTHQVGGLIYASSSSIYGDNKEHPYSEEHKSDQPISLYGMTKKANELQAYCYYRLHGVKSTGLRFFTVYGTYGRPDMALFMFTEWALKGEPMKIFGEGKMQRDFTYVDDIVAGILAAVDKNYDYEIFNLGGGKTEELMDYVGAVEKALGIEAKKEFLPMQQGDVVATSADISKAQKMLGYDPKTHIDVGVPKFVEWYRQYYGL
jgi:UDP-glucuronate 4-epimerase